MKFYKPFILVLSVVLFLAACATNYERIDPHQGDIYFWPKEFENKKGASLIVYQPQIIAWTDFVTLKARMVLSYQASSKDALIYGTVLVKAKTEVDLPSKNVKLTELTISALKVSGLSSEKQLSLQEDIQKILAVDELIVSLDRMTANHQRRDNTIPSLTLKTDAPKLFVSKAPAALMILDGKPIWSPIKDNTLEFALNTNWDLFRDKSTKFYYVRYANAWFTTSDLNKPWASVFKLPDAFFNLPKTDNWKVVKANLPKKALAKVSVPKLIVSQEPAELILIEGEPELKEIEGTQLSWVSNTDSDLFFSSDNYFYYLVSGRWFRSKELSTDTDWAFVTDQLPEDFMHIPVKHVRASVRASVPGTIEAETAVLMAQIPQKVKVKKGGLTPTVDYAGKPDFKIIENTDLSYAINTSSDVILYQEIYYLCQDGVWFESATAKGPWRVTTKVPEAIYLMPASSPVYHVTYVRIYDQDTDTVTVGYTSGYSNVYVSHGVVVYGTGWYYPPYYYYDPYYYAYPIYYHYPYSYGANTYYNPNTGTYGRAGWAYGPYGGVGSGAAYNPKTGTYVRAAAVYGPSGTSAWLEAYNPRTNTHLKSHQGSDYYSAWGATGIERDNQWAMTVHYKNEQGGVRGIKTSQGKGGYIGYDENNLYAGKDGEVYRRNKDGWQQQQDGDWESIDSPVDRDKARQGVDKPKQKYPDARSNIRSNRPGATGSSHRRNMDQLNRDHRQRKYGAQRLQKRGTWQGGGQRAQSRSSQGRGARIQSRRR